MCIVAAVCGLSGHSFDILPGPDHLTNEKALLDADFAEEALASSAHERVDHQPQLVLRQGAHELTASVDGNGPFQRRRQGAQTGCGKDRLTPGQTPRA